MTIFKIGDRVKCRTQSLNNNEYVTGTIIDINYNRYCPLHISLDKSASATSGTVYETYEFKLDECQLIK